MIISIRSYIELKRSILGIKLRFWNKITKWKPSCLGAFSGPPRSFSQVQSGQHPAGIWDMDGSPSLPWENTPRGKEAVSQLADISPSFCCSAAVLGAVLGLENGGLNVLHLSLLLGAHTPFFCSVNTPSQPPHSNFGSEW